METCDIQPDHEVRPAEYLRLLGYPPHHEPGERPRELMAWARAWYAQHGRPWVYLRRASLEPAGATLRLDGVGFHSPRLQERWRQQGVQNTMLVAASAGPECEEHARQLWHDGKPDEYFFLEMFGSAVVEDLVARASGRICDLASHQNLMAVPPYSPGYTGWDVAEQNKLFDLIAHHMSRPFPGPLEVLASGMLRPKKSLLAVFGLAPRHGQVPAESGATPCENCAFAPCQYRRAPYRHAATLSAPGRTAERAEPAVEPLTPAARYSVNSRALGKWAAERVQVAARADGTVEAVFRFDGTTCSDQGRPLAFAYRVLLSGPDQGYRIQETHCLPAPGDDGYRQTCAYLADPDRFLQDLAAEKPLIGRPLDDVLRWSREAAPAGCHCTAESRTHKWGLALEAIHYALVRLRIPQAVA